MGSTFCRVCEPFVSKIQGKDRRDVAIEECDLIVVSLKTAISIVENIEGCSRPDDDTLDSIELELAAAYAEKRAVATAKRVEWAEEI